MKTLINYVNEVKPECLEASDFLTPFLMVFFFVLGYLFFSRSKKTANTSTGPLKKLSNSNIEELKKLHLLNYNEFMQEEFFINNI